MKFRLLPGEDGEISPNYSWQDGEEISPAEAAAAATVDISDRLKEIRDILQDLVSVTGSRR